MLTAIWNAAAYYNEGFPSTLKSACYFVVEDPAPSEWFRIQLSNLFYCPHPIIVGTKHSMASCLTSLNVEFLSKVFLDFDFLPIHLAIVTHRMFSFAIQRWPRFLLLIWVPFRAAHLWWLIEPQLHIDRGKLEQYSPHLRRCCPSRNFLKVVL